MNTLSVLLIIGSAVVGPIEAQPVAGPNETETAECLAIHGNSLVVTTQRGGGTHSPENYCRYLYKLKYETLPELCERAMREVGVFRQGQISSEGWLFRPSVPETMLKPQPGRTTITAQSGDYELVRCIPTPSGYRK